MANPTVRIPKSLLSAVDRAASNRSVKPAAVVTQALRFYLTATDPALVASAVAEILRPLAADIQRIKCAVEEGPRTAATRTNGIPCNGQEHNLILELVEQRRRAARGHVQPNTRTERRNTDA